ncbi:hypothetical protein A2348_04505 [Candidatus Uhrbacteria bacterium RIFOXYB12_FULL_58_10]|uniref:Uncharacterized protein n=1 Tax=Candidatus Uhrbacteria bacterium RIFOXYB2_FULL_57_15 TaxID=1802422 RepID=A0A1F7W7G7_9BACT|nr:MAG: hypothetical protein A2348_04505 [Candidatus Uhrbacteria bacterium RIFOXYB12_FULL_58_10]OGL98742.1 MAG: hypothetical protein A2304_01000 [Candidatus Uhrbacteria bacterium RIFOXYB2_FULL_57_15]
MESADKPVVPFNPNGGLTLVAMPGFEEQARRAARRVDELSRRSANKQYTPVDLAIPEVGEHPSGEPYMYLGKRHIGGHDCVIITSGPGTHQMQSELFWVLNHLQGRHAGRITVVTGYFPLGRTDKDEGEKGFAMVSYVVAMMQAAANDRLSRIVSVDMHAAQTVGAGRSGSITELSMVRVVLDRAIRDVLNAGQRPVLVFPDDGSAKRTGEAIDRLEADLRMHLPVVCGIKRRKSSTHAELRRLFGDVDQLPGAIALCVDDEIATGGTNVTAAAGIIGEYRALEVRTVVTHGVFGKGFAERFSVSDCPVSRVYVTDTIPPRPWLAGFLESGRIVVVPWTDELAEALYFMHWNTSIRSMR